MENRVIYYYQTLIGLKNIINNPRKIYPTHIILSAFHFGKDDNGESRPFAFIAMGGSSNGSTLEGHSYRYVGSTWGKIVDILIETQCLNPIIFIDELDKISKTENGREIIGILTHLTDSTQNEELKRLINSFSFKILNN